MQVGLRIGDVDFMRLMGFLGDSQDLRRLAAVETKKGGAWVVPEVQVVVGGPVVDSIFFARQQLSGISLVDSLP